MTAVADAPIDAPAAFLAARRRPIVTERGVYNMSADDYHADPVPDGSLSASGTGKLLPPSCPALFDYERRVGRKPTAAMEFGTIAHKMVLGVGPEIDPIDAPDRRKKVVQQRQTEARAEGMIPMLQWEYEQVLAMAKALRQHPDAAALLDPDSGTAEQSLFWQHGPTGVWRRCRPDWLQHSHDGRMIIPDYKTCLSAADDALSRSMFNYGYHRQGPWYEDGVVALDLAEEAAMVFIFQEKNPPYLVRVLPLDAVARQMGREQNAQAIEIFAECQASDIWPGYPSYDPPLCLPVWVENNFLMER